MDSYFEQDLFKELYHLVGGTDTFEAITEDVPMFDRAMFDLMYTV